MTHIIKRFNRFLALAINFFEGCDKLLRRLEYLSNVIDALVKEQKDLNRLIEDDVRFKQKFVERERLEGMKKEEALKPSEFDMRY